MRRNAALLNPFFRSRSLAMAPRRCTFALDGNGIVFMTKWNSLEFRFWSKVQKSESPNGCWTWQASINSGGYGLFNSGIANGGKIDRAHRVSWTLTNGPIPDGLDVLHRCDNRKCVRPDHLWLGTQRDNTMDCERKGRAIHPRGEEHGRRKLTSEQVLEIRRLHDAENLGCVRLSRMFNVSANNIKLILRRKYWNHI